MVRLRVVGAAPLLVGPSSAAAVASSGLEFNVVVRFIPVSTFATYVYRVWQQNFLLEIEKRAALGSTSQCSPVLPSYPFPVGHSVAELGTAMVFKTDW